MFRIFIYILCFAFSSPSFAMFKSYPDENIEEEWSGNPPIFHQKLNKDSLTEAAVEYGLQHLPIFKSNTLEVKEIAIDEESAGFTEKLFLLTASNNDKARDYILKVHPSNSALNTLENLHKVKKSRLAELDVDNKNLPPILPRIAFDIWSGYYEDAHEKRHYFSLFKKAPGISFDQLLDQIFQTSDPSTPQKLIPLFESWGIALGSLHHKFADPETLAGPIENVKTFAIHHDLQNENFFYDEKMNVFTLIDYEKFAESVSNSKLLQTDLALSLPANSFFLALFMKDLEPFLPVTASFIRGYSSVWPNSLQAKSYILSCLNNFIESSLKVAPNPYDEEITSEDSGPISKFFDRDTYNARFSALKQLLML